MRKDCKNAFHCSCIVDELVANHTQIEINNTNKAYCRGHINDFLETPKTRVISPITLQKAERFLSSLDRKPIKRPAEYITKKQVQPTFKITGPNEGTSINQTHLLRIKANIKDNSTLKDLLEFIVTYKKE